MIVKKRRAQPLPQMILVPVRERETVRRRIPPKLFRVVAVIIALGVLLMTGGIGATVSQLAQASVGTAVSAEETAGEDGCFLLGCIDDVAAALPEMAGGLVDNVENAAGGVIDTATQYATPVVNFVIGAVPGPIRDAVGTVIGAIPDVGKLVDIATDPVGAVQDIICMYTPVPTEETQWSYDSWPGKAQMVGGTLGKLSTIGASAQVGALTGGGAGGIAGAGLAVNQIMNDGQDIDVDKRYVDRNGVIVVPASALDWYGTSGLKWTTSNYEQTAGQCAIAALPKSTMGIVTDSMWTFITTVGSWGSTLFYYASVPDALDAFLAPGGVLDELLTNSLNKIFIPFLWPMMLIIALWVAWKGLVKKRSSESIQGVVWVVLAASATMFFLAQPVLVMSKLNSLVSTATSVILNVVDVTPAGSTGWCSLNQIDPTDAQKIAWTAEINKDLGTIDPDTAQAWDPSKREKFFDQNYERYAARASKYLNIRESQCTMWQTFLFSPWASGQFGSAAGLVLVWPETGKYISDLQGNPLNPDGSPATVGGLNDMTVTVAGRKLPDQTGSTLAVVQLDSSTFNHDEVNALGDRDAGGLPQIEIQRKAKQQLLIYQNMEYYWKLGNQPAPTENLSESDMALYRDIVEIWSGNDPSTRVSAAILALLAMIIAAGPIFFMTFNLLIYQFATVILLMVAPIFLTVGIHPGFGRKVALGWVEQVLNLALKRVGVAAIIAIMLAMFNMIFLMDAPLVMQVFMMAALGIAVLAFRKRIMNMIARVNLDGDGINNIDDALRQKSKQAGAAVVGAAVGGTTAAVGGASPMGIAQAAGSSGGAGLATGSPKAALTTGLGTGIAAGNKGRADTERKEELADQQRVKDEDVRQDQAIIELLDWLRSNGATREELTDVREIAAQLGLDQANVEAQRIAAEHQGDGALPGPAETTTGTPSPQEVPAGTGTPNPSETPMSEADKALLARRGAEIWEQQEDARRPAEDERRERIANDPALAYTFIQGTIRDAIAEQSDGGSLSDEMYYKLFEAMDYSTASQAPDWINYYQQTQTPIPAPNNILGDQEGLIEALRSAGVEFMGSIRDRAREQAASEVGRETSNRSVMPVVSPPTVTAPTPPTRPSPPTRPTPSNPTPNLDI